MGNRPSEGDVFTVQQPFETTMRLFWRTPSTEERRAALPAGLELKVISNPTLIAREAVLQPTDLNGWEPKFVSEQHRTHGMYGGYAFAISFEDLRANCSDNPN